MGLRGMKGQEDGLAHKIWARDITGQWGQQPQRQSWGQKKPVGWGGRLGGWA